VKAHNKEVETMMLKNEVAVIYGSSGAVGSAIAGAFAREGARVFLTAAASARLRQLLKGSWMQEGGPKRLK
jgi:NAD(P)-dependent dehydrogenase (short-subunit alcohol dehydrogenase family)